MALQRDIIKKLNLFTLNEVDFFNNFPLENYFEKNTLILSFTIPCGIPLYLHDKINNFNKNNIGGIKIVIRQDTNQLKYDFLYEYLDSFLKTISNALLKSALTRHTFKINDNKLYIVYWTNNELELWNQIEQRLLDYLNENFQLHLESIVYVEDKTYEKKLIERQKEILENQQKAFKNFEQLTQQNKSKPLSPTSSFKQKYQYSKKINEPAIKICDIHAQDLDAIVEGKIFKTDLSITKNETYIYKFFLTDYSSSIILKGIAKNKSEVFESIKKDCWIKAKVKLSQDKYEQNNIVGTIQEFIFIDPLVKDYDDSDQKRIELCAHTKMSAYDGLIDVNNLATYLKKSAINTIGICDKNNVQIYPEIAKIAKKNDLKILYGYQVEVIDEPILAVLNANNERIENANYVVFDLETTGLYANCDDIIEFGAVKYVDGTETHTDIFIKPRKPIEPHTTNLTNITNEMLADGYEIKDALEYIVNFIGDSVIVAHNGISFDFNFLNAKLVEYGFAPLKNVMVDTMVISRAINEDFNSHSLGSICRKFYVEYDESSAHRADYDAKVLFQVYRHFINKMQKMGINHFDDINQHIQNDSLKSKSRGDDVLIYVKNQKGIHDLYELISIASTTNYYRRPTLTWNLINQKRANLLIGNAPVDGEIFEAALNFNDAQVTEIMHHYDFITIAPSASFIHLINDHRLNYSNYTYGIQKIIRLAQQQNKLICASSDPYYLFNYEKCYHDVYVFTPGLNGKRHRYYKFETHPNQHIFSGDEMKKSFAFLENDSLVQAIVFDNPNNIANSIEDQIRPLQKDLFAPKIDGVNEKVIEYVYQTAHNIYGEHLPKIVEDRIKKELDAIIGNGYAVVYWISHLLVEASLKDGYVVGSRGSVGSSLVATLLNITDVNPLSPHYLCRDCHYVEFVENKEDGYDLPPKNCPHCQKPLYGEGHSIPFETFLGFKGDKVPDIDLNFSGVYQPKAHNFIKNMFLDKHAFRAGTIATVAEKTSYGYVKGYFEFIDNETFPSNADIERYAYNCLDVKRTTGQHPGGIVVVPEDMSIFDFTPYNYPADDTSQEWFTTHFAFEAIHDNLLKFDILGHDNPTALKMLKDLTHVDEKDIPNQDEKVMELFSSCEPLGITPTDINNEKTGALSLPEFGTNFVRGMLNETKPRHFSDLIRLSGLSHGTDVWLGNAQSLIKSGFTLENVIGCRDDIMVYLMSKNIDPSRAFAIMEDVRKGKQIKKEDEQMLRENHIPDWWIDSANKIKYMFPKAHATAYVMHAWKFAYYKLYYPLEYYATYFSIRPTAFDLEIMVKPHNVIAYYLDDLIKKNNMKISPLTTKQKDLIPVLEILLEMKARGFEFLQVDLLKSKANEFIIDYDKKAIIAPFTCVDSLGETVAQSIVEARNNQPFTSIDDLIKRTKLTKQHIENLTKLDVLKTLPKNNQISLFDDIC